MKIRNNLRLRFVISFIVFAMLINIVFSIVLRILERKMAEEFFETRIVAELDYFEDRYKIDPNSPTPIAEDIRSYLGTEKMPLYLKKVVSNRRDGVHDLDIDVDDLFGKTEHRPKRRKYEDHYFFGVRTLHDNKKIYIFVNYDFWYLKEHELYIHTFWAYIVALLTALVLGWITANRVINPLKQLMKVVEQTNPDNLPSGFSKMFQEDEIGLLAQSFESSFSRVQRFIKRENQFTRDASHELRTPVTVVKGAVELLNMTPACEDKMINKLVKRIDRSTRDMETTIESLLWLARESSSGEAISAAELLPLVENAIEQNRHLIEAKPVEIELKVEATPIIKAPPGVLAIALSNLIRNACQFTSQGQILVTVKESQIDVQDTGIGIPDKEIENMKKPDVSGSSSDGFGFGLDIVSRLCARFGWKLNIESELAKGTKTSLIFS